MQYIAFEVDKIEEYVFDSFKPKEVLGAAELISCLDYDPVTNEKSPILEKFTEKDRKKISDEDIIYSRGGNGLLLVKQKNAESLCQWLEQHFGDYTKGGILTAVAQAKSHDFKTDLAVLDYKLRDKKSEKPLTQALEHVTFTRGDSRCNSCGKRPFEIKFDTSPGPDIPPKALKYCETCYYKRKFLKEKDQQTEIDSLADILKIDPQAFPALKEVKETGEIMVIYGNVNEVGTHRASCENAIQLAAFSLAVFDTLALARQNIQWELNRTGFSSLIPVVRGDEIIIFTHPASFQGIKDKLFQIESSLQSILNKPVNMNFSFLVAKKAYPIYHLYKLTESLLELTKAAYYKDAKKRTHYGFCRLVEGGGMPEEKDVYLKEDVLKLFEKGAHLDGTPEIGRPSSLNLKELLSQKQAMPDVQMNMDSFLSRYPGFNKILGPAQAHSGLSPERNRHAPKELKLFQVTLRTLEPMVIGNSNPCYNVPALPFLPPSLLSNGIAFTLTRNGMSEEVVSDLFITSNAFTPFNFYLGSPLPNPVSLRVKKGEKQEKDSLLTDYIIKYSLKKGTFESMKGTLYNTLYRDNLKPVSICRHPQITYHTQALESMRAEINQEEMLYSMEIIPKDAVFMGLVIGEAWIREALASLKELFIGGQQTIVFTRTKIEKIEEMPIPQLLNTDTDIDSLLRKIAANYSLKLPLEQRYFSLDFLLDLPIPEDNDLKTYLEEELFSDLELRMEKSCLEVIQRCSHDLDSRKEKSYIPLIRAGSTLLLSVPREQEKKLKEKVTGMVGKSIRYKGISTPLFCLNNPKHLEVWK